MLIVRYEILVNGHILCLDWCHTVITKNPGGPAATVVGDEMPRHMKLPSICPPRARFDAYPYKYRGMGKICVTESNRRSNHRPIVIA